jgi:RNA polymerase sigma-70 factor (ECF subfamily)
MTARSGFFADVDDVQLARARRGDLEGLEAIYRTYSAPIYNLAVRVCRSPQDGEEILQETFLELARSIDSYRGAGAFGAWLRRVTVSKILMHQRRARVRPFGAPEAAEVDLDRLPSVRFDSNGVEARCDVERALARLSSTARMVVWLHDVEGLTHAEVAELLDGTVSFSKSQLSRAHRQLRRWLEEQRDGFDASNDGRVVGAAGR